MVWQSDSSLASLFSQGSRFVQITVLHHLFGTYETSDLPCAKDKEFGLYKQLMAMLKEQINSFRMNVENKYKWATKKPSYFPLYWIVNRDPYNGLL